MVEQRKIRRSISGKIILMLFSCVLLLFVIIIVMLAVALDSIAREETYYRLNNYVRITSFEWRNGDIIRLEDEATYNIGIIQGKFFNNNFIAANSDLIQVDESLLPQSEISKLLLEAKTGNNIFKIGKKEFYYVCDIDIITNNFIIILVDDTYSNNFIKRVVLNIIIVITVALIILAVFMSFWVSRLVKRIKKLQDHITSMNKDKYEIEYLDNGDDEIRELSESIENMRLEIKDSETTKREMLQNVSHDFKTPIAVIKNYAEAIVDGVVDKSEANLIIKQADVLKSKVNQLLQYNRLEYLNKDLPFENVDLADVCNEVVNNHKYNTNIEFVLNLSPCVFSGYRENFITVIENIVDNALRYAKKVIKIETKKDKITIYNDGEPIEEKFLNTNFKPYEKGSKGEFGLGMSIVQKTLDFFELKLKIYNEDFGGVSFIIYQENKKE